MEGDFSQQTRSFLQCLLIFAQLLDLVDGEFSPQAVSFAAMITLSQWLDAIAWEFSM